MYRSRLVRVAFFRGKFASLAIAGVVGTVLLATLASFAAANFVSTGKSTLTTANDGVCALTTHAKVATYATQVTLKAGSSYYTYASVTGGRPITNISFAIDFSYADPWLSGPGNVMIAIGHSSANVGNDSTNSLYPLIGGSSVSSVPYARSVYLAQNSTTLNAMFHLTNSSDVLLVAALSEDYSPTLHASHFHVVVSGEDNPVDSILIAKAALTAGWHSFALNSTAWVSNSVIGAVLYYFAASSC